MTTFLFIMALVAALGFVATVGNTSCFTVLCAFAVPVFLMLGAISWAVGDPYDDACQDQMYEAC